MEFKYAIKHKITIEPTANNGFIVKVGCGKFAFGGQAALLQALSDYLIDPEEYERRYNNLRGPHSAQPVCEPAQDEQCDTAAD